MKPQRPTSKNVLLNASTTGQINESDGELVLEFIENYGTLKNLSRGSINKYFYTLRNILVVIHSRHTSIQKLQEKDVLAIIHTLRERQDWSEDTRSDYWVRFTVFYKWVEKRYGSCSENAKRLIVGEDKFDYKIDKNKVEKKGTLTPEEMLQLIHTEPDLAYKTFFAVLYESGMRIKNHSVRSYLISV